MRQNTRQQAVQRMASARVLKDLEANFFNGMAMAVQMCQQGGQHLAQFGCSRIGVDQQTPFRALDRARLDGASKWPWNQGVQELEPLAGHPREFCQVRQAGRLLRSFHEGDRLIEFDHVVIMREPR